MSCRYQLLQCSRCQTVNVTTFSYCHSCGRPLPHVQRLTEQGLTQSPKKPITQSPKLEAIQMPEANAAKGGRFSTPVGDVVVNVSVELIVGD